jgi:hypothetical protein
MRPVISLNDAASERCSVLPSTSALAVKSPWATRRDLGGDHRTGGQPEGEHDQPDQDHHELGPPNRAVDGADTLRDPHRARGLRVVDDRNGGGEDLLPEGLRAARDLVLAAAQCRVYLRPARIARAELSRSGAVRQDEPSGVDDQDSASDGTGGIVGEGLERGAVTGPEEIRRGGRHEVHLRLGLRLDFGVHPCAQVDGQRHSQRDDGQQKDVGQCRQ